jgi:hypothetical protein
MTTIAPSLIRQRLTIASGLTLLLGVFLYLARTEETMVRIGFVIAISVSISVFLLVFSKRILFAAFATAALVTLLQAVSSIKIRTMDMALHSYDFFLYLNWQTMVFLWSDYRRYLVWAMGILALVGIVAVLVWRLDKTRCPRLWSSMTLAFALAAVAGLTAPAYAQRRPGQIFGKHPISNFYLSFGETFHVLMTRQFVEAAPRTQLPAFAVMPPCSPSSQPRPTVLLIHQESLVPPGLFAGLSYDHGLDSFFVGDDQILHRLGVETYGGGSWLSDFSLFNGISTRPFGEMRSFLHVFMRNKLKETLPQIFTACGYRSVLFFPLGENFIALGKFFRAIGFETILDQAGQNAPSSRERDRFYFKGVIEVMERKFKASDSPLFIYVQTMAAHGPYDFKYMPEEAVSGGGPGTAADMDEFLRRLAMAKRDGDLFIAEIKHRFPDRRFLIVRYGDHQPTATRPFLNLAGDSVVNPETAPAGFVTYYTFTGLNYAIETLPAFDQLDIAFLGTVMMEAAGIPLPEAYQERQRLMALCGGRYYECKERDEILSFHRRLIDSGIIQEP